jgi:hypothetical protein
VAGPPVRLRPVPSRSRARRVAPVEDQRAARPRCRKRKSQVRRTSHAALRRLIDERTVALNDEVERQALERRGEAPVAGGRAATQMNPGSSSEHVCHLLRGVHAVISDPVLARCERAASCQSHQGRFAWLSGDCYRATTTASLSTSGATSRLRRHSLDVEPSRAARESKAKLVARVPLVEVPFEEDQPDEVHAA